MELHSALSKAVRAIVASTAHTFLELVHFTILMEVKHLREAGRTAASLVGE